MAQTFISFQLCKDANPSFPDFDSDCDADFHLLPLSSQQQQQQQQQPPKLSPRRFPDLVSEDELESKLRLLDIHRQKALERCEKFMCDMESAIQNESSLAASPAHSAFPSSKSVAARPMPSASPSWVADQSYYKKKSSRRTSISGSVSEPQCSHSSRGSRRRSSSRRSSWAADACGQSNSSSGRVVARSNPWAAE